MIIAIDIGNTTVSLALMNKERVMKSISILHKEGRTAVLRKMNAFLRSCDRRHCIEDVVVCSVVPKYLKIGEALIKKIFHRSSIVIGRDIKVPIKNNYRTPSQVGQDRLVGAFAAKTFYGYPVIIIDFGTAITFDVVNSRGEYDGGIIVPGIRLSAESLFRKTALLPEVSKFKAPRSILGKNTKDSILSGLFHGYGALCNGLIDSLRHDLRKRAKVVITGGHTQIMKRFISHKITSIDSDLVFKGNYLTYQKAMSKR